MFEEKNKINNYYKTLYGKDFSASTLSKWKKEGKIEFIPHPNKKG